MRKINLTNNSGNKILENSVKNVSGDGRLDINFKENILSIDDKKIVEKIDLDLYAEDSDNMGAENIQEVFLNQVDRNLERNSVLSEQLNNDIFSELEEEINIINERINGNG